MFSQVVWGLCMSALRLHHTIKLTESIMKTILSQTLRTKLLPLFIGAVLTSTALAAPPRNDSFAAPTTVAPTIPAGHTFLNGTTKEATWQTDEVDTNCPSVWYSWTASFTGAVGIKTSVAMTEHWVYAIYGTTQASAKYLAIGFNNVGGPAQTCKFYAVQGRTYRFCVACDPGNGDNFKLEIYKVSTITSPVSFFTPGTNDNFGAPYSCSNTTNRYFFQYSYEGTNQTGEAPFLSTWCPSSYFNADQYGGTWCKWTAPKTGTAHWDCRNITSDPRIFTGVFTGSTIPSLSRKTTGTTSCTWPCVAGTTYKLYCISPFVPDVFSHIYVQ